MKKNIVLSILLSCVMGISTGIGGYFVGKSIDKPDVQITTTEPEKPTVTEPTKDYTEGLEFTYYYKDTTNYKAGYRVTGYNGADTEVVIPSMYNGAKVTGLYKTPFANRGDIKSVIIGDNVTAISNIAFDGCTSLEYVVIPAGIEWIGGNAFTNPVTVYYKGTGSIANKVDDDFAYNWYENVTTYSYSEYFRNGLFWHYVDGKPEIWA